MNHQSKIPKVFIYSGLAMFFLVVIILVSVDHILKAESVMINASSTSPLATTTALTSTSSVPQKVTLSFVGDIMLDRGVKSSVIKNGKGDYGFIFQYADFLKTPDLTFANLEGPVSTRGTRVGSIYSFHFDPAAMPVLKEAGFDALSMANNHIGDYARPALEDTITHDKANGLAQVGGGMTKAEAEQPQIFQTNGIKVGYLGFSDFGPSWVIATASSSGILSATDPRIKIIIANAAAQVDILVVSYHFGVEYQTHSNARQRMLARLAIDAGAKIIAGAHPHVPEEVEQYHGGIIAYSLGNFVFDQYFSKITMGGMMLNVTADKNGVLLYSTSTISLNKFYQPSLGSTSAQLEVK